MCNEDNRSFGKLPKVVNSWFTMLSGPGLWYLRGQSRDIFRQIISGLEELLPREDVFLIKYRPVDIDMQPGQRVHGAPRGFELIAQPPLANWRRLVSRDRYYTAMLPMSTTRFVGDG